MPESATGTEQRHSGSPPADGRAEVPRRVGGFPLRHLDGQPEQLKPHHLAESIPSMSEQEYTALAADIEINGLLQPVVLFEGKILDGRERYRACLERDVELRFDEYIGDRPLEYVLALNLKRRHLSDERRAFIALELLPELRKEARERMVFGGQISAPGRPAEKGSHGGRTLSGRSTQIAADLVGISRTAVERAATIATYRPDLEERLMAGELSFTAAYQQARKTKLETDAGEKMFHVPKVPKHREDKRRKFTRLLANQVARAARSLKWADAPEDLKSILAAEIRRTISELNGCLSSLEGGSPPLPPVRRLPTKRRAS